MKIWIGLYAFASVLITAGAAMAGQCGYNQCWGAVGIGPYGTYGYSHSYSSENAAWNRAQSECGGNCTNIKTFYNTCGAMASASNGAWGFGWAGSRAAAESNALDYCYDSGNDCRVVVWSCSP